MSTAMFIVGFCIFAAYVGFLMWNIFYNHRKNREENYPGYYSRHTLNYNEKKSNARVLQEKTKRNKIKSTRTVKVKKEDVR
jgi:hypothetical protein